MTPAPFVTTHGVRKTYPGADRPAVDGADVVIATGSFFGLLGPNGAGKTTLLSMLTGLMTPDSGRIEVGGHPLDRELDQAKRLLGLVPQELAIYPTLTARENLAYFGAMQGLHGERLKSRIETCLEIVKLTGFRRQKAGTFSGGLKRRLNLAVGLLHEPKLLVLDEPTVGIDPQSRNLIFESLRELNDKGMTVIYTTHYMEEVEQLCDTIAIIDQGKIIAAGSLDDLLNREGGNNIMLRTQQRLPGEVAERLGQLENVAEVVTQNGRTEIRTRDGHGTLCQIMAELEQARLDVRSLSMGATNLEQLFLQLTGTSLRD